MNTVSRRRIEVASVVATVILVTAGFMIAAMDRPIRRAEAQPPMPTPSTQSSYCNGSITSTLSAATVRVCDPITVTVVITPVCQGCGGGLNVVFGHVEWVQYGKWMQQENYAAIGLMEQWQAKGLRVQGAVIFIDPISRHAQDRVGLTEELARVRQNLVSRDSLAGGYQCLAWDEVVRKGIEMFKEDRSDSGLESCEAFVNYACGSEEPPGVPRQDLQEALRMAVGRGAGFFVGCAWRAVPRTLCNTPRRIISPRWYFEYPERGRLRSMIATYDGPLTTENGQSLSLWQRLPSGLTYVAGSASVTPTSVSTVAGETVLAWAWTTAEQVVPQQVAYQVRPAQEGQWPVSGEGMIVDKQRRNRLFSTQPVTVTVAGLCQTPTPAATPTDTPPPTATATPPPTATSTPTATARPRPVYLPLTLTEECIKSQRRVDVALVIDASTSMLDETSTGRSKLDAAKAAAGVFLDQLDAGDQAAIVAFNSQARLLQQLTADRAALRAAIAGITAAPQTCIVCAVEVAADELVSARRHPDHTPVLILLTDGKSNPRPVSEAEDRAGEAKRAGVIIFTVGLGDDLDFGPLERIASRLEYFHRAPNAEDLAGIYQAIAVEIPCPVDRYWGRR